MVAGENTLLSFSDRTGICITAPNISRGDLQCGAIHDMNSRRAFILNGNLILRFTIHIISGPPFGHFALATRESFGVRAGSSIRILITHTMIKSQKGSNYIRGHILVVLRKMQAFPGRGRTGLCQNLSTCTPHSPDRRIFGVRLENGLKTGEQLFKGQFEIILQNAMIKFTSQELRQLEAPRYSLSHDSFLSRHLILILRKGINRSLVISG